METFYTGLELHQLLHITTIYSVHYFEYGKDYVYEGEEHRFWEFVYVDRGEVVITSGDRQILLQQGEAAFHEPMEFHAVQADGKSAPNLIVVSFSCDDAAMAAFRRRIIQVDAQGKAYLAGLIAAARKCLLSPLDKKHNYLMRREDCPPETEQILLLNLELFLLHLMETAAPQQAPVRPAVPGKVTSQNNEKAQFQYVKSYLLSHISDHPSVETVCRETHLSVSTVQKLIRKSTGMGINDFSNHLRIEAAKLLIREKNLSFSQIAGKLGYNSLPYFSRQFRKISGMSPTEYARSLEAFPSYEE
jgi:AraC-like DNA-binding protein